MKKYLFNKITIKDDGVHFIPFRKVSVLESFLSNPNSSLDQEQWVFSPNSFRMFLKMLSKTKLTDNNEYDISTNAPSTCPFDINYEIPISFDTLLQEFASEMYVAKAPSQEALQDFYTKAYAIKQDAELDKALLEKEPSEFVNQ